MLDRMEEIAEEQSAEQSSVADRSSDFFDSENNDDQSLKGSRSSQEGNEFYVLESHAEGDEEESESVSTTPNESIQMVASEDEDDVVGNANQKSNTLNEPIHEYDPVHIMGYEDLPLDDDDDDRKPAAPPQPRRLGSFLDAPRPDNNVDVKSSTLSKESERTSHSAPARTEGSAEVMATTTAASEDGTTTNGPPRRVTVHAHPDHGNPLPDHRRRFPTIYGSSRRSTEGFAVAHTGGEDDPSGRPHHPFWRTLRRRPHREPARAATSSVYHRSSSSSNVGMDAVERLRTSPHGSSTDFPHGAAVVAAATLPASVNSSSSNNNNRGVQFAQGDHVLVMLSLLDMADQFGDKESYTIDPVNAWGYPRGQGQTEVQKHGPYLFVLCAVTQVHFDEDERYYTVRRIDTGTEQRADMTYMEPIRDEEAIEAARQAAQRTERTMADQLLSALAPTRCGTRILRRCGEWQTIVVRRVVPWYAQMRNCAKTQIRRWMYGEHGCALHLRFSGINFLVLCSLFFLFLEVMLLAFFPNNWDRAFAIIGL